MIAGARCEVSERHRVWLRELHLPAQQQAQKLQHMRNLFEVHLRILPCLENNQQEAEGGKQLLLKQQSQQQAVHSQQVHSHATQPPSLAVGNPRDSPSAPEIPKHGVVATVCHDPALLSAGLSDPGELALGQWGTLGQGCVLHFQAQQTRSWTSSAHPTLKAIGLLPSLVLISSHT